jgi:hypothetical protein
MSPSLHFTDAQMERYAELRLQGVPSDEAFRLAGVQDAMRHAAVCDECATRYHQAVLSIEAVDAAEMAGQIDELVAAHMALEPGQPEPLVSGERGSLWEALQEWLRELMPHVPAFQLGLGVDALRSDIPEGDHRTIVVNLPATAPFDPLVEVRAHGDGVRVVCRAIADPGGSALFIAFVRIGGAARCLRMLPAPDLATLGVAYPVYAGELSVPLAELLDKRSTAMALLVMDGPEAPLP